MTLFSSDPAVAKKQMLTVVFMLTAFGHMDGKFSLSEKRFLQEKIGKLVEDRVNASQMDPLAKQVAIERTTQGFQKVAAKIDKEIAVLYTESVSEGESIEQFVYTKLALRCYELLKPFDEEARGFLFEIVDELIMADGVAHPEETRLREDIQRLLSEPIELEVIEEAPDTIVDRRSRSSNRRRSCRARTITRSSRARSASTRATKKVSWRAPSKTSRSFKK